MGGKQMEGDNEQRRNQARQARRAGKKPSEIRATLGGSKQRTEAQHGMTHQQRLDLKREGKQDTIEQKTPQASPGARDADTLDHERYPRL